ncbi:MAG: hypothetical protein ACRC62_11330 [Microcoleus sp.]
MILHFMTVSAIVATLRSGTLEKEEGRRKKEERREKKEEGRRKR